MDYQEAIGKLEQKLAVFVGISSDAFVAHKLDAAGNTAREALKAAARDFLKSEQQAQDFATLAAVFECRGEAPGAQLYEAVRRGGQSYYRGSSGEELPMPDTFDEFSTMFRDVRIALTVASHPDIRGVEQLAFLHEVFETGEANALIKTYERHRITGTRGTAFQSKTGSRPAVIGEQGVLRPNYFSEYMDVLRSQVQQTLEGKGTMELQAGALPFLHSTLNQMIDSVSFGSLRDPESGHTLAGIFGAGKKMGRAMEAYARAVQVSIPDVEASGTSPVRK